MKTLGIFILCICTLLGLSACKSNSQTDSESSEIGLTNNIVMENKEDLSWDGYTLTISKDKFLKGARIVKLTKENWNTYFKDYPAEFEKKIKKNAFGDIEKEYYSVKGDCFDVNKDYIILYNPEKVAFKFDGVTVSNAEWLSITSYDEPERMLTPKDYKKENRNGEEYYIARLNAIGYTYTEHNLLDVIGTIIVIDIPELKKFTEFKEMNLPIPTGVSIPDANDGFTLTYDECKKFIDNYQ